MAQPPRFVPHTQLDALRALLSGYIEGDRTFLAQFTRSLQVLQQQALPELGQRLARTTTPRKLRQVILQSVWDFDWPEWEPVLMHMLQPEEDLGLFDLGCAALGRLCTRRAMEGLLKLKATRREHERQGILDRELAAYQPEHPFEVYLSALLAGESNPDNARQGACGLVAMVDGPHLADLMDAFHLGDALARHLVLHVLTFLPHAGAEGLLVQLFQEAKEAYADVPGLQAFLPTMKGVSREALKEHLLVRLGERMNPRVPLAFMGLKQAVEEKGGRHVEALELAGAKARGPTETFLVKAIGLLLEGKVMGFNGLVAQTLEELESLQAAWSQALGDIAAHVAARVQAGLQPLEEALPMLEEAFRGHLGGDGVELAYLCLLPAEERARLDKLLEDPDPNLRRRGIEVLGAREEDRLVPFFLRAMNDPIKEIGLVAIHQIGKLPSGYNAMLGLFRSGQVDRVREAIRFFGENRSLAAVKPLMGFLATESQDELLVDAAQALGKLGDPSAVNALLMQLHSGKPLQYQLALVQALGRLGTPAASLGLLKKSEELIFPQVLLASLEGVLTAFPGFDQPFPPEQVNALEHLARRVCDAREGAGQWTAAALALEQLHVFDKGLYERLADAFQDFLDEVRPDARREVHDRIHEIVRRFGRHAEALACVKEREAALDLQMVAYQGETGGQRLQALYAMQQVFTDPWLILSVPFSQRIVDFLKGELAREDLDVRGTASLCDIAGHAKRKEMIEPLRDLHAHTALPELKSSTRNALVALGLSDKEIQRRAPIRTILLLEPNAFFRKRLASVLEGQGRTLVATSSQQEAEAAITASPVDLLLTESHDLTGDLSTWILRKWEMRRCRYVLLSTSSHDLGTLMDQPWVIGRLYKPYPIEELVKAIEG